MTTSAEERRAIERAIRETLDRDWDSGLVELLTELNAAAARAYREARERKDCA